MHRQLQVLAIDEIIGHARGDLDAMPSPGQVRNAVPVILISAVPPLMVKTDANPGGLPKEVFQPWTGRVPGGGELGAVTARRHEVLRASNRL